MRLSPGLHFTPRELTLLEGLVKGNMDKENAYELGLSVYTAQAYMMRLQTRTGLTRAQLAILGYLSMTGVKDLAAPAKALRAFREDGVRIGPLRVLHNGTN